MTALWFIVGFLALVVAYAVGFAAGCNHVEEMFFGEDD